MEAIAPWLKLVHVFIALALVAGLIGRWIVLSMAARSDDVERGHLLSQSAGPFERTVQVAGPAIVVAGMVLKPF